MSAPLGPRLARCPAHHPTHILVASVLTLFAGAAQAASPKVPVAIKAELKQALKDGPHYAGAVRPSFKTSVVKDGKNYTAQVTLRVVGHDGPAFSGSKYNPRVGVEKAWVDFSKGGRQVGKIQTSPIYRLDIAKASAR